VVALRYADRRPQNRTRDHARSSADPRSAVSRLHHNREGAGRRLRLPRTRTGRLGPRRAERTGRR
jgi:hypothetical protein